MAPIHDVLGARIPSAEIIQVDWLADVGRRATLLALRGTLATTVIEQGRLGQTLHELLVADDRPWIVVAYSAGGWIFYQWLLTATAEERRHIRLAFTIGSPYRNVRNFLVFDANPARAYEAERWQLDARRLARALRPGRLHAIVSDADTTIWPINATFPASPRGAGLVQHLQVTGVKHSDLCRHPDILAYIDGHVAKIL